MKNIEEQAVKILVDLGYNGDIKHDTDIDMFWFGTAAIHVDKDGNQTRIDQRNIIIKNDTI